LRVFTIARITAPMKTFVLLVCLSALSLSTIRSDDACCESKAATIQAKLQDIDLDCLLTKYEELKKHKAKAEVQLVLLEGESDGRETEVRTLEKRIHTLTMHAKQVRAEIEEMIKPVSVAAK
jgi:hypothetical protein